MVKPETYKNNLLFAARKAGPAEYKTDQATVDDITTELADGRKPFDGPVKDIKGAFYSTMINNKKNGRNPRNY